MVKSSAFFKIKAQMCCNNRKVFTGDDFERTSYLEKDVPYSITVDSACVYLQYIHTVGYPFNINMQLKLKSKYLIRMFSFSFNNKSLLENHHMCRMWNHPLNFYDYMFVIDWSMNLAIGSQDDRFIYLQLQHSTTTPPPPPKWNLQNITLILLQKVTASKFVPDFCRSDRSNLDFIFCIMRWSQY